MHIKLRQETKKKEKFNESQATGLEYSLSQVWGGL